MFQVPESRDQVQTQVISNVPHFKRSHFLLRCITNLRTHSSPGVATLQGLTGKLLVSWADLVLKPGRRISTVPRGYGDVAFVPFQGVQVGSDGKCCLPSCPCFSLKATFFRAVLKQNVQFQFLDWSERPLTNHEAFQDIYMCVEGISS